jgi:hypothetical protein
MIKWPGIHQAKPRHTELEAGCRAPRRRDRSAAHYSVVFDDLLVKSEKRSRVAQLVDSRRTGIALQSLIDSRKVTPHESEPETVTMEIEEFNDLAGGLDMEDVILRAHT